MKYIIRVSLLLVAAVAGLYGYLYFSHTVSDRSVAELTDKWADPPSQFMTVSGMQVHYRDEGPKDDPLPIVLLHGTSASLHTWDGWAEVLATHHRVIRFDMQGFGLTGPHPKGNYRIQDYAQTAVQLLDSLGISKAIVSGNSLGGYVAWSIAVLYPERVAKLVLVDASGYPFESESTPIGFRIYNSPLLTSMFKNILPRSVVRKSLENVYGAPEKITEELVDRYFELTTREGNRAALAERFIQTKAGHLAQSIGELLQPTLILWGEKDTLIPMSVGQRFHRELVNSQFVSFKHLGHVPHEEDPLTTVFAVEKFLHRDE